MEKELLFPLGPGVYQAGLTGDRMEEEAPLWMLFSFPWKILEELRSRGMLGWQSGLWLWLPVWRTARLSFTVLLKTCG